MGILKFLLALKLKIWLKKAETKLSDIHLKSEKDFDFLAVSPVSKQYLFE